MITKLEKYNESLRDLMVGPTEEEVLDSYKDLSPYDLLITSAKIELKKGVELALDRGADINDALFNSILNKRFGLSDNLIKYGANIKNIDINRMMKLIMRTNNYKNEILEYLNKHEISNPYNKYNESLRDLMVGPTEYQVLSSYQKQFDNGDIDILTFYDKCKKNNIKGGPTEDEVWDSLKDLPPTELLIKSCEIGFTKGVEVVLGGININDALYNLVINKNFTLADSLIKYGADLKKINLRKLLDECEKGYKFQIWNFLRNNRITKV